MDIKDKEFFTIVEFVTFAKDVSKEKGVKNFYRLISNEPNEATKTAIKQVFSSFFSNVLEYENFTGSLIFKTGLVHLGSLEKACLKNADDAKAFKQYIELFKDLYTDVRRNLAEFMKKLNLDESSPEASFISNIFNDIGPEIFEAIKSGGNTRDIASLLPKMLEMVKSGKLMNSFEKLKTSNIKISKILRAFLVLVEEYENQGVMQPQITAPEEAVTTTLVDDDN